MAENTISREDALELIAEAINESVDDVQPGIELVTLIGWDSMAVLLLMAEFDDQFDIVLDEEKINSLKLVDDILAVLEQNNVLKACDGVENTLQEAIEFGKQFHKPRKTLKEMKKRTYKHITDAMENEDAQYLDPPVFMMTP